MGLGGDVFDLLNLSKNRCRGILIGCLRPVCPRIPALNIFVSI